SGDAQVVLSDAELYSLISIAINDLDWVFDELGLIEQTTADNSYFQISFDWFEDLDPNLANAEAILSALSSCFEKNNDFALYIENLSALHRRRVKYKKILSSQPLPTMDQIGPRVLLEFGGCDTTLLANWMMWRKWIYDVDNRAAQETGYLFEPLLASCLGGEPVGAKNSPVKRIDSSGVPTKNGRQIDCLVPTTNRTYELKLRVTIAASGQGRFGEELSFPFESQSAGFTPVLLVLDPTPSARLTELSNQYLEFGGEFYQGEDAWNHIEQEAGDIVSIFIDRYIKPAVQGIEDVDIIFPQSIQLSWTTQAIEIAT
ncbi:MAG: hypothetical protein ACNYPE_07620, partial [Candidatus Azotimanducaceae bacterium WSBS_2022_MAG_OTU7]